MGKPGVFFSATFDGVIDGVWRGIAEDGETPNPDRPYKAKNEQEELYLKRPKEYLYKNNRFSKKPVVSIKADKFIIKSDDEDYSIVVFEGVPANFKTVKVNVSGVTRSIDPQEPIEISTDTAQVISVSLEEELLLSVPIIIRARRNI